MARAPECQGFGRVLRGRSRHCQRRDMTNVAAGIRCRRATGGRKPFRRLPFLTYGRRPAIVAAAAARKSRSGWGPSTTARRGMGGASFYVDRWLTAIVLVVVGLALAVGAPSRAFAQEAELVLSKSGPASAAANTNVTYSLNLLSGGPDAATDVTVSDPLPPGMNFVSLASPAGWTCTTPAVGTNGTVSCTNPSLAARQRRELFAHHGHSELNAGGHGLHQRRDGIQHDVRSDR